MMKKEILIFIVFILLVECESVINFNDTKDEKNLDLLSELIKEITDPCPELCQNGGVCVATENDVMCICTPPYFGKTCSEDPCTRNPCHNGGKCQIERDGFVSLLTESFCKSPYRGENCTLDPCLPNPCENDGKCKISGNGFNCTCKNPYYGDTCEFGPCEPNPCKNGGECEQDGESFNCSCESPFTGRTCEKSPCSLNPCQNDGKCSLTNDLDFKCTCNEPFSGKTCEKGPCTPNPCKNGGHCKASGNGTKCLCPNAFFGEYCEQDLCSKMPCKNNGTCIIEGSDFKCECKSPFIGKICEKDLCSSNPCKNDGICKLDGSNFKCECKPPYSGKECENGPCSSNPCLNNGGCKVEGNTFRCKCVPPFAGKHCESGPCSSNPCFNNGKCRVTGLNFKCECQPPYQGKQCEMRNNTEPDISTTTTTDSTIIRNITYQNITELTHSYNWTSSESTIFTSDENATTATERNSTNGLMSTTLEEGFCETDNDCLNGGICRKTTEGEYSCICKPNFGGSRCEVNLPCVGLHQSCRMINAVCVLIDNHAICVCPNGTLYHKRSGLCEDICDARKCLHGKCEVIGRTYKCNCDEGYTGSHCDEEERRHHENFVPWFTVIASINLFICILLIGMFCVVCHIKRFITTA
ncbi:adhesive plaque matrix protein 2-like [Argiope bruennichi]|uniref:adhesive plaque matrix protein 2-like n=1 Tax=Argiope bruennichi TaxID=94029 RepID=UPI00249566E5|nr:adhesive plaque matrix protein 2-like [Argiope bruennichi]